jgi:peptide deformylase
MLRKKAIAVDRISKDIFELIDDMIETMLKGDGIGIAANQVGSLLRIFVINTTPGEDTPSPGAIINPKVVSREGSIIDEEGCLSFPELYLKIPRPEKIRIQGKNLYNEDFVLDAEGIMARVIQHELDHLDGILFIDYVSEEEREKLDKYLQGSKQNSKVS